MTGEQYEKEIKRLVSLFTEDIYTCKDKAIELEMMAPELASIILSATLAVSAATIKSFFADDTEEGLKFALVKCRKKNRKMDSLDP